MPSAKGSCICGDYTYEYVGESYDVVVCNCHPCRKYYNDRSVNLITDQGNFKKLSGTETVATRKGDSGKDVLNHCCSKCLAVMWTEAKAMLPSIIIKAGTLDDPAVRDKLKPTAEIYCRNRPAHFEAVPGVPQVDGAPS